MRRIVLASATALVCVVILSGLGIWQMQRRAWKNDILQTLETRLSARPFVWDTSTMPPPEFSRVTISGDFRADKPLRIYGRTLDGVAGIHVVVSLFPRDERPVMIDQGFMPLPQTVQSVSSEAVYDKTIVGIVRYSPGQGWFEPDNNPGQDQWFWTDIPAMARSLGIKDVAPVYIELTNPARLDGPIATGESLLTNIPNQHLNYAITWFSLAGVSLIIYAVWLRREILSYLAKG